MRLSVHLETCTPILKIAGAGLWGQGWKTKSLEREFSLRAFQTKDGCDLVQSGDGGGISS